MLMRLSVVSISSWASADMDANTSFRDMMNISCSALLCPTRHPCFPQYILCRAAQLSSCRDQGDGVLIWVYSGVCGWFSLGDGSEGGRERLSPQLLFAFTQTREAHCRPWTPASLSLLFRRAIERQGQGE